VRKTQASAHGLLVRNGAGQEKSMADTKGLRGVFSPVVTPFKKDLTPDRDRWIRHCRWLRMQNCGLAVFGTNSEANSLSLDERMTLLSALVEAGLEPKAMMPGTGCCAIPETARMTSHALELGCAGVLMLPPFYYKGVSDEGLFRYFSAVIQRVGDARLRIYLYHIPPVAQVPISLALIERLLKAYPEIVAGVKDSSGDWRNTEAMLKAFPGFGVFAGNETTLLATLRGGGAGCISATANVNAAAIHDLYANWQSADADGRQEKLNDFRFAMEKFPMIPALKETIASFTGNPEWSRVRPPLIELTAPERKGLHAELEKRDFQMPGLAASR